MAKSVPVQNTGGGTTVSFTNTPQAKDDDLKSLQTGLTEDSNAVVYLDVMGNDLGGNAKSLWSVDNGINDSGAMAGYVAGDLLTADAIGAPDRSLHGAKIWITADGKIGYDPATMDAGFATQLQGLAVGETLNDSFIYAIRLGNGTLSWATATVQLAGVNDIVSITSAPQSGAVVEDADTTPSTTDSLNAAGTIAFNDVDLSDTHTATFAAAAGNTTALGTFALGAVNEAPNAANGTVGWSYQLNNSAAQYLAAGQSETETYKVTVDDGHGSTATQDVTVTITGTNDVPVITSSAQAGAVSEGDDGSSRTASGQVTFTDVDTIDTHALSVSATAAHGAAQVGQDGKWNYTVSDSDAVDALAAGEHLSDSFTVQVDDHHGGLASQTVSIDITGTNDVPVIGAAQLTGGVTEQIAPAGNLTSTGTIAFGDVDLTDSHSVSANAVGTPLGTLTAGVSTDTTGSGTGGQVTWNYSVADAAVEYLAAGQTKTESFTVSLDDHNGGQVQRQVDVTITGTNDVPVIGAAQLTGAVTEQIAPAGDLTRSGTIAFGDVDLTDSHSVSANAVGTPLGTLTAGVSTDTTGSGTGGQVTWNYSVADSAVEYLAAGQTKTESFTVSLDDHNGGQVQRQVDVTITGTNDAPVVTAADLSGTVTAMPAGPVSAPSPLVFTVQQFLGYQSNDLSTLRNYAATHAADYTVQTNVIDYTDDPAGFAGEIPGSNRWPAAEAQNYNGTGGFGQNNVNSHFFARITADFSVSTADTYTFRTFNDDGVFLLIDNQLVISDNGYHPEAPYTGSIALAPGNHSIELFFYENEGEASLEFSAKSASGVYGLVGANGAGLGGAIQVTDSGSISFSDVDLTDTHVVSAAPIGTTVGTLTAVKASDTTGTGTGGQVNWTYTADNTKLAILAQDETKYDHFTVTVNDLHGGVTARQVDVSIVGVNDAPVAVADSGSQKNNEVKSYAVLVNDTDVDQGAVLSLVGASVAANSGSVQIVGGQIQFDPGQDFKTLRLGEERVVNVSYTVADEHNAQSSSTLAVTVVGTNTPPQANPDSLSTNEDTPLNFDASALLGNDTDPDVGDTKSIVSFTNPTHGTLTDNHDGTYTYAPAANYNGPDAFSYTMKDAAGEQSSAQVSLNVNPVNDPPVAVDDTNALTVTTLASQVHSNVVNWVNWTSNTVTGYDGPDSVGTVAGTIDLGNGNTVGVTYTGEYLFAQTNGGTDYYNSPTAYDHITPISPIGTYTSAAVANPPPNSDMIALNLANQTRTLTFSKPVDNLYFAVVSLNNNGYVFDQDFQVVSYGPGYWGNGTLARQPIGDGAYKVVGTGEPHGVLSIDGSVQTLTWTSAANEAWNGFTVGTYGLAQTATATGNVLSNDSDVENDPLSVSAVNNQAITGNSVTLTLASGATLNVNKDGTYLYDENGKFGSLAQGQSTQDSFQYTVSDGHGGFSTASVVITVNGVNDAPVIGSADLAGAVTEMGTPSGNLTDSGIIAFSDVDLTDSHVVSVVPAGSPGPVGSLSAVIASDTTGTGIGGQLQWTYTVPAAAIETLYANQQKVEKFNVTLDDQHGGTVTRTVDVTLTGTNDAPVANNDTLMATEDTPITYSAAQLLGNDTDIDNLWTQLSIASVANGAGGTAVLNGNGTVTFTPNANFNGVADFTYTATDGLAQSNVANATVNVAPLNDAPVITYQPAPNLIVNGSFENPGGSGSVVGTYSAGSTSVTGWTVTGNDIDYVGTLWPAADGTHSLDLNGFKPGGVQQTFATVPGRQYTVTFDLAKNPTNTGTVTVEVSAGFNTNKSYDFSSLNSLTDMKWKAEAYTFTATSATTTLSFKTTSPTDASPFKASGPALDAISLVQTVTKTGTPTVITGLNVSDLDAGSGAMKLTLAVDHGALSLANTAGLTAVDGNGGDGTLSYSGAQSAINAALASGVAYTPVLGYGGADSLSATIDDQGLNGSGGALSAIQLVGISVVA